MRRPVWLKQIGGGVGGGEGRGPGRSGRALGAFLLREVGVLEGCRQRRAGPDSGAHCGKDRLLGGGQQGWELGSHLRGKWCRLGGQC